MKKILLVALNAKYFHTNLAVRCLKAYAGDDYNIKIVESTINDNVDHVLDEIISSEPDAVGFSCYIWNIEQIVIIADNLKKVLPNCTVFMGGPEVSFDCENFLRDRPFVDFIIKGEGEITFSKWIEAFNRGEDYSKLCGIVVRSEDGIVDNLFQTEIFDLNNLPFLYEDLSEYDNKIIYFETSRGCPMNCAYCMSGISNELSYMDVEKSIYAFEYFMKNNVKQIKLVDRTFNFPPERAKKLIAKLIELRRKYPNSITNFHFEITASILDDEFFDILSDAPYGLLQFEAGVQSINPDTLREISRSVDSEKLLNNIKRLSDISGVTVYADLIAGLPYESYDIFKKSFNDVYKLNTQKIHLGFLKVLKGSKIWENAEEHGIVHCSNAPYKVLKTHYISYKKLRDLEQVEKILDIYKNSENFGFSIEYAVTCFNTPFDFYEGFMQFFKENKLLSKKLGILKQFDILYEYMMQIDKIDLRLLKDKLAIDWAMMEKPRRYPEHIGYKPDEKEKDYIRKFYNDKEMVERILPEYIEMTPSQISRMCHILFLKSEKSVYLFDYKLKKADRMIKIT